MNKKDLIAKVAMDVGLSKSSAEAAIESFLHGVTKALAKGRPVTLVGFGSFRTSVRKARTGRNPRTGANIRIPKRTVARFSAGKALRDVLN
jgi:DNA-binding protein HU-beta